MDGRTGDRRRHPFGGVAGNFEIRERGELVGYAIRASALPF